MQKAFRISADPTRDPEGCASVLEQWIYALSDFEPVELDMAYKRFLLQWRWQNWPAPAFMRELALEARKELHPRLPSYHKAPEDDRPPRERQRMERQMAQWRGWMAGEAPANTYPHNPDFDAAAQYDWIYDGSLGEAHRLDMIAKIQAES